MTKPIPPANKRYRVRTGEAFRTMSNDGAIASHYGGDILELPEDIAKLHQHRLEEISDGDTEASST